MNRMIPWINNGEYGFFEYTLHYQDIYRVARNLDEMQSYLSEEITNKNNDRLYTELTRLANEEFWKLSDEEQMSTDYMEFVNDFKMKNEESVKTEMLNDGRLYPEDLKVEDLPKGCIVYTPFTSEDAMLLKRIVESCPDISQMELEDIFYHQNSKNYEYLNYKNSVDLSISAMEQYETNLAVSELLVQNYEEKLAVEEQLVQNSEMIVQLYETINQ